MDQPLCAALRAKVVEQIERTVRLAGFLPGDLSVRPVETGWTFEHLLDHLLLAMSGFCAVLAAVYPDRLAHFQQLRDRQARGGFCEEAAVYRVRIEEGFDVLEDAALSRVIPTIFVPEGQAVMTLLLGNLEHLVNHKHQLFMYLKISGAAVGTGDLYRLRG